MKLYSKNENYKLYQGNMLDMLEVIQPNTIDSVICDPPYELNFMNKGWDNSGIAFQPSTWQKCYEVLKPGGYLLAFGGSRTFHRIACAIEDAGFEIRDTIMWLYGSGFPKSMDMSKQIDKKPYSKEREEIKKYIQEYINKSNKTRKQIDEECGFTACSYTRISYRNDDGWGSAIPSEEKWNIMKKVLNFDDKWDWYIKEAEREVIGTKTSGCFNSQEKDKYTIGSSKSLEVNITAPSTDLAKQWQGWGTALKPSFEPIIVARKPFKGSLVDNVIEYGVGGINIDECRVEIDMTNDPDLRKSKATNTKIPIVGSKHGKELGMHERHNHNGRFPANTILTYDETDFEEVCGNMPNTYGSFRVGIRDSKNCMFDFGRNKDPLRGYTDSGSASRYFYCAKASKKDRDEGCQDLEDTFNACSNQAIAEQKKGNNNFADENNSTFNKVYIGKNTHPTVKPTELMQYLVRLVSPNGATILDPFNGSGSTGKAVMYENRERNKNYKYIGIELTEEYLPISKARIEYVCNLTQEELKEKQMTIFDLGE